LLEDVTTDALNDPEFDVEFEADADADADALPKSQNAFTKPPTGS
jgi:hypothetical protein